MFKYFLFFALFLSSCAGSGSLPQSAVGRNYYQLSSGYTCTGQSGGTITGNYKAYIAISSISGGTYTGLCASDTVQYVNASSITLSADLNSLTYNGTNYSYSATKP